MSEKAIKRSEQQDGINNALELSELDLDEVTGGVDGGSNKAIEKVELAAKGQPSPTAKFFEAWPCK